MVAGAFDALIEHILSTPLEAMDYERERCAPLMTKAFSAHVDLRMRQAAARGTEEAEDTLAELQLLRNWVTEAMERGEERDDAARRRRTISEKVRASATEPERFSARERLPPEPEDIRRRATDPVAFPTPLRTASDKFGVLMSAASRGVDALRDEIITMAASDEIDDALMAILTGNAANAEADGDDGRAKFLFKIAEVCLREKKNAAA
jgi:hypothetical protein